MSILRLFPDGNWGYLDNDCWKPFSTAAINSEEACLVLLPGADVTIHSVTLPKLSLNDIKQAVPNLLEEQLADDIATLHFAIGNADKQHNRLIAVINNTLWQRILDFLRQHDIKPDCIIPDYFAVPFIENQHTIIFDQNQALIRLSQSEGCTIERSLANEVSPPIQQFILDGDLARHLNREALIDSAAFNMAPKHAHKKQIRRSYWQWCAISGCCLVGLFFLGQLALYLDLKVKSHQLNNRLLALYQKSIPNKHTLSNPRYHLKKLLKEYQLIPNPFLATMKRIAKVKPKNIAIESILYQHDQVTLELSSQSNNSLNNFNQSIQKSGLSIANNESHYKNKKIFEKLTIGVA